jgi:hypothetical protein
MYGADDDPSRDPGSLNRDETEVALRLILTY